MRSVRGPVRDPRDFDRSGIPHFSDHVKRPNSPFGMRRWPSILYLWILTFALGCAGSRHHLGAAGGGAEVGHASYYTTREQGGRTASGERYDDRKLTAAHRTLPFGTRVRVTNLDNGRSVVLRITDRGPFRRGRVIDVSRRAADELGFLREGTARVRVEVMDG